MELLVATTNRHKLLEIERIMKGLPVRLRGLGEFPGAPDVEETEETFLGNAVLKARALAAYTGLPALADDSGLVVPALGGAPGVYSARYAGVGATDRDNLKKLLSALEGVPEGPGRSARFVCALALAMPDGTLKTFEGVVEGRVGLRPLGQSGFGYDPLFYPEGRGRTFAQMGPESKDALSHRRQALQKLKKWLSSSPPA